MDPRTDHGSYQPELPGLEQFAAAQQLWLNFDAVSLVDEPPPAPVRRSPILVPLEGGAQEPAEAVGVLDGLEVLDELTGLLPDRLARVAADDPARPHLERFARTLGPLQLALRVARRQRHR